MYVSHNLTKMMLTAKVMLMIWWWQTCIATHDDDSDDDDVDDRVVADMLYSNPCGAKYLRQPINKVTLTT